MSSDKERVAFFVDQLRGAGEVRSRAMFGEYGIYCDERFVAMVCDNQLFVKASPAAAAFLDDSYLAPPYPGATDAYRVPEERWEDAGWLSAFVAATAQALPAPKPKSRKQAPGQGTRAG